MRPTQIYLSSVIDQVQEGTNRSPSHQDPVDGCLSRLLHLQWGSTSMSIAGLNLFMEHLINTGRILLYQAQRAGLSWPELAVARICKQKKESHVSLTHFTQMQAMLQMAMMSPYQLTS